VQINSNIGSQDQQLWRTRHQSIEDMVKNVQAGNMPAAQQALSQVQQADQSLGISEGGSSSTSSTLTTLARSKMNLSSLMTAVQSGDLTSAQTAWQNIQANSSASGYQKEDQDGDQGNNGMAKDISSLLTAVNSGDASGMQSAATAVAKDLQSLLGTQTASTTGTPPATQPVTNSTTSSSTNSLVDDLNALVSAAQKGDTTSAQAAEQKLVQDLQGSAPAVGAAALQQVGGHHHHHHHHAAGGSAVTASTTSAATAATLLSSTTNTTGTATTDTTGTTATTSA